jgi:hypothetical protein
MIVAGWRPLSGSLGQLRTVFGPVWVVPGAATSSYHIARGKAIGAIALQKEILVHTVLEPVAASGYGDDFGVMEKSVEDGAGGRHVAKGENSRNGNLRTLAAVQT